MLRITRYQLLRRSSGSYDVSGPWVPGFNNFLKSVAGLGRLLLPCAVSTLDDESIHAHAGSLKTLLYSADEFSALDAIQRCYATLLPPLTRLRCFGHGRSDSVLMSPFTPVVCQSTSLQNMGFASANHQVIPRLAIGSQLTSHKDSTLYQSRKLETVCLLIEPKELFDHPLDFFGNMD